MKFDPKAFKSYEVIYGANTLPPAAALGKLEAVVPANSSNFTFDPSVVDATAAKAVALAQLGTVAEGAKILGLLAAQANDPQFDYEYARFWSLSNNAPSAVAWLRKAVGVDQSYAVQASGDPLFGNVRKAPDFEVLVKPFAPAPGP